MPTVKSVENQIYRKEGFRVAFYQNGRDVRDDAVLTTQYTAVKMSKNSYTVKEFKRKLARLFSGFDFKIYKANGKAAPGQMKLSTLRDTYLDE